MTPDWVRFEKEEELKAEVERLKKELEKVKGSWIKPSTVSERCRSSFNNGLVEGERRSAAEVELLKKDFSGQLKKAKRAGNYAFNNGVVEGERRAMERVKEAIKTSLTAYQVETKLGLGGEEKR